MATGANSSFIKTLTSDEEKAQAHFLDTHKVLDDGRFSVKLPRVDPTPRLGESRTGAVRRYLSNERTLKRKGQLEKFTQVLKEYLQLNHAEVVPTEQLYQEQYLRYYLPVHGVIKEDWSTTKL